jgi:hypothetical protein
MATDIKKTKANDLTAKIKSLQDTMDKQASISLIDIDIQLDNIRSLYDFYLVLKNDILLQKEKNAKKSNLSDCGTLSLFADMEDENDEEKSFKEEETTTQPLPEAEVQQPQAEHSEEKSSLEILKETTDNEAESSTMETEEPEVEPEINKEENYIRQEPVFEAEREREEETGEETNPEEIVTENITPAVDMDIDTNADIAAVSSQQTISSEEEEEEEEKEEKKESRFAVEIDIDSIEFAEEDEDEKDVEEEETLQSSFSQMGVASGRPVYWGDEIDMEQPIARPTSIGETFKSERPSLNEIVSGFKPDESIGMKLQNESVSDLMKSIDMNNKFLFVKELFKGNGSAFTEEINKLNSHSKLDAAIRYLDKIKEKYQWDEKGEAYNQLYHLILKKYAK